MKKISSRKIKGITRIIIIILTLISHFTGDCNFVEAISVILLISILDKVEPLSMEEK